MFGVVGGCFLYWIKIADCMSEKNSRYMNENISKIIFDFNGLAETLKSAVLIIQGKCLLSVGLLIYKFR